MGACVSSKKTKKDDGLGILLLGSSESGKSTLFKQCQILQDNGGFTKGVKSEFREMIYLNVINKIVDLIKIGVALNIEFDSDESKRVSRDIFSRLDIFNNRDGEDESEEDRLAQLKDIIKNIRKIWEDGFFTKVVEYVSQYSDVVDSTRYLFKNIKRYISDSFVPNEQDIIRARVKSNGIESAIFRFDNVPFKITDVAGHVGKRDEWAPLFKETKAVIFFSAMSDYCMKLREDDKTNRMKDSLGLFKEICNHPFLKGKPIILFLNKKDIFKEKLKSKPLSNYFSAYKGEDNYGEAKEFVRNMFLQQLDEVDAEKIKVHFTCAVCSEGEDNIGLVLKDTREYIVSQILASVESY